MIGLSFEKLSVAMHKAGVFKYFGLPVLPFPNIVKSEEKSDFKL